MDKLPWNIQRAIARYEPIPFENATLFPITMEEYEEFTVARQAIEFMQQQFKDVRLMSMPILQAYYEVDSALAARGEPTTNLFFCSLLSLALAFRLAQGKDINERVQQIQIALSPDDRKTLKCLRIPLSDGSCAEITPAKFQKLRAIIAAQNGLDIEADEANPDLVQSKRDMQSNNAPALDARIEIFVSSVAALSSTEEAEIYRWPILKFERRAAAIKRAMDYMIYTTAELQGTKWKGGNPTPNPWFDRKSNDLGLIAMGEFTKGQAVQTQSGGFAPPLPTTSQD